METQVYFKYFLFILDARDCQTALISSSLYVFFFLSSKLWIDDSLHLWQNKKRYSNARQF